MLFIASGVQPEEALAFVSRVRGDVGTGYWDKQLRKAFPPNIDHIRYAARSVGKLSGEFAPTTLPTVVTSAVFKREHASQVAASLSASSQGFVAKASASSQEAEAKSKEDLLKLETDMKKKVALALGEALTRQQNVLANEKRFS